MDSLPENDFQMETLLAGQLDALLAGRETHEFFKGASGEQLELLHLANQLHFALRPVEPSPEFIARLKAEFVSPESPALVLRWRKLPARYRFAARLGGGALTAGLALIAVRRALNLLGGIRVSDTETERVEANSVPVNTTS